MLIDGTPTKKSRSRAGSPGSRRRPMQGSGAPADLGGPIRRGSAEQSHSNIMFGEKFLLKLFRRLDLGVNPDFEIGRFLTEKTSFTTCRRPWFPRASPAPDTRRRPSDSSRRSYPTRDRAGSTSSAFSAAITNKSPSEQYRLARIARRSASLVRTRATKSPPRRLRGCRGSAALGGRAR